MDGIYSFLNLLLPFEWAEFDFMKNALLAVLMITPLFGLTGTMIVKNKMSFLDVYKRQPDPLCGAESI